MSDITKILGAIVAGDPRAAEELLPLVYDELRKLAAQRLAHEKPGQTLQATAQVHEAYLRLADGNQGQQWNSRGHFFGAAAEAMRRILVEQTRHKKSAKAGGQSRRVEFDARHLEAPSRNVDLIALDEARRRVLVENARRKLTARHGAGR